VTVVNFPYAELVRFYFSEERCCGSRSAASFHSCLFRDRRNTLWEKFNVLQNKLLTRTADNGRVSGIKMNPGSQRGDSLGDVSTTFCFQSTEPSVKRSACRSFCPRFFVSFNSPFSFGLSNGRYRSSFRFTPSWLSDFAVSIFISWQKPGWNLNHDSFHLSDLRYTRYHVNSALSLALQPFVGPWQTFQFPNL
jgi:hypothetical protein